jgi:hypothetical protein
VSFDSQVSEVQYFLFDFAPTNDQELNLKSHDVTELGFGHLNLKYLIHAAEINDVYHDYGDDHQVTIYHQISCLSFQTQKQLHTFSSSLTLATS